MKAGRGTYPHLVGVLHLAFLALLLLCSHSWGACTNPRVSTSYYCRFTVACGGERPLEPNQAQLPNIPSGSVFLGCSCSESACAPNSYIYGSCTYLKCDTQAETDSVYCALNPTAEQCKSSDPSECTTAECCMEFNQGNVPLDSGFVGCEPPADGSDACAVSGSSAVCNGVSVYSYCTQLYMWNKQTKQCAPVSTNNCTEVRRTDEMCTDVTCESYTESEVSGMTFNPSTKCYEGKYREYTHMECSNGVRGQVFAGAYQDYKVCDSYLDSLGVSITESTGNQTQVSITDYISGQYDGGTSVDGEGNTVTNSPGGQTGGTSTQHQEVVTKDSAGTTVIVKASDGSDSTQMVTTFSSVRCLGCSNGFCTLSNGSASWTCQAHTCSAALMSYNMNGGLCSANYNEYYNQPQGIPNNTFVGDTATKIALTDSVIDYTEQLNRINKNLEDFMDPVHLGDGSTYGFFGALAAMQAVVQNTSAEKIAKDSALHHDLILTLEEFKSAMDYALNVHAGRIESATSAAGAGVEGAIGSAGSAVAGAITAQNSLITSAASSITSAVTQGSGNIVSAVHATTSAVNSASSTLSDRIMETTSAVQSIPQKTDSVLSVNLDAYYDRITPVMAEQTQAIVSALDTMQVALQLDTVHVDSVSIRATTVLTQDAHVVYDTANFERLWLQGYGHGMDTMSIDTSMGSGIDTTNMYDGRWVPDSTVDSVEAVLPAKFDSASAKANVRSDSMTRVYAEKLMRVSGVDSAGNAVEELFSGYSGNCPRDCFRVNMPRVGVLPPVSIHLDTVVCDIHFAGGYTLIDFMKLVLRLFTSLFCVMMIWSLMVKMGGGKK